MLAMASGCCWLRWVLCAPLALTLCCSGGGPGRPATSSAGGDLADRSICAEGSEHAGRQLWARELYYALSEYEREHGLLPYSQKGPNYALYKLKAIVLRADVSSRLNDLMPANYPGTPFPSGMKPFPGVTLFKVDWGERSPDGAAWDDARGVVLNVQYDYLNEPRKLDRTQPAFAVYAEKVMSEQRGRWVVFSNGAMLWIPERNTQFTTPLGRSWKELRSAMPDSVAQPVGDTTDPALGLAVLVHADALIDILLDYENHRGHLPFSARGGDYALYGLRPRVRYPWVFDAYCTHLENGVAYWDEKDGRVQNADYEYLNDPTVKMFSEQQKPVVVLAEKWGVESCDRRLVLFSDGMLRYLSRGSQNAEQPLGKTAEELEVPPTGAASR